MNMSSNTESDLERSALPASKTGKAQEPVLRAGGRLAPKPLPPARLGLRHPLTDLTGEKPLVKAALSRVDVKVLPKERPDFEQAGASKDMLIADWLRNWITEGLNSSQLTETTMLPRKAELAKYLGVSIGTVQNAIRYVEDDGLVESKQRIGTVIRNPDNPDSRLRKQTSKRDQAVLAIRKLIVSRGLQPGEPMPSAREVAKLIGSAPNTTRLALEFLSANGVLHSQGVRGNKANWFVENIPDISSDNAVSAIESETLIDQLERDLKGLILSAYKVGDKLPSHLDLADQFKVSIKTVHDALRRLGKQGIIQSKRGRYGTYVNRLPDPNFKPSVEMEALFIPAEQHAFYNYQRVEELLRSYIADEFQVGDKLPPMGELAERFQVSSNTIRKALQNMGKENLLRFSRGRFGGTFVEALPKASAKGSKGKGKQEMTMISVNPASMESYPGKGKK